MTERKKTRLQLTLFFVVIMIGFGTWFYFLQNRQAPSPHIPPPLNFPMQGSQVPLSPEMVLSNSQKMPSMDPAKLPPENPAALRPAPSGQPPTDAKNKAPLSVIIPEPLIPIVKTKN